MPSIHNAFAIRRLNEFTLTAVVPFLAFLLHYGLQGSEGVH
jgi:hypothetical protein